MSTIATAYRTTIPDDGVVGEGATTDGAGAVPWYVWAVVFASTSVALGVMWDISWHRTIGRDTFWTPAHMAIYLGGAAAGLSCGWLVLQTTFAGSVMAKAGGVTFWGFRGPLGAWVCIWGAFAMIASGPFDDWWHNAYGLDVEILSPPHTVLAAGIIAIQMGAMLMVLSRQNNVGADSAVLKLLLAYTGGVLILMMATLATEEVTFPNVQRSAQFYLVSAGIFPLFSAEPLLGPILRPVDSMIPPAFPLLLVVPALAVDVLTRTLPGEGSRLRPWLASAAIGVCFVLVLLAVQWFFSAFLLSEGARNFVFGADQWDYNSTPGPWQHEFWGSTASAASFGWAALIGSASARVGLWWGDWMSRVRR